MIMNPNPPRYYNSSWQLLSQGAEARVWLIPNFFQIQTSNNNKTNNNHNDATKTMEVICKERFSKSYRHPVLNDTLTKARTKAEARSLTRCRRGGVSVPVVLGVDMNMNTVRSFNGSNDDNGDDDSHTTNNNNMSACLFLEKIQGCTLRSFFNNTDTINNSEVDEPLTKRIKLNDHSIGKTSSTTTNSTSTRLDAYAKKVAHATGIAIGKMHNLNIIHGDLTTSNIFLRNPPTLPPLANVDNDDNDWKPDIVMIDFGLSSISVNSSKKNKGQNHQSVSSSSSSCHEERAVDLYVLERAFVTTHVGGEALVEEILRGYKSSCMSSDSVLQRLSQVRLRGRKRECFG